MAILKSDNATHSETQAKLVAFAFMIVVIVLYVTLVAMQYHRVDKYMFRMTALDTRYAFMLPLLMVITFLFLVSSKVFVWAIVPSGLVDAYGLLTFFSIMVEYCGGAQHVISFVNREGKPLTSIPFLHFSVFVEDARLYYSRTITALKYLCFLRPVLLFLHGFAFLYGGYVGKTVGILICSVSFVILTLAFVRVLTICTFFSSWFVTIPRLHNCIYCCYFACSQLRQGPHETSEWSSKAYHRLFVWSCCGRSELSCTTGSTHWNV